MAFVDFEQVPNDAPAVARAPEAIAVAVPVARPVQRKVAIPYALLGAFAVLLWIGQATAAEMDSPLLGFVAATLVFLIGVAAVSAVQPARRRR